MRTDVYAVADKEKSSLLENKNYERLLDEVQILVTQLYLPAEAIKALSQPDFSRKKGIQVLEPPSKVFEYSSGYFNSLPSTLTLLSPRPVRAPAKP